MKWASARWMNLFGPDFWTPPLDSGTPLAPLEVSCSWLKWSPRCPRATRPPPRGPVGIHTLCVSQGDGSGVDCPLLMGRGQFYSAFFPYGLCGTKVTWVTSGNVTYLSGGVAQQCPRGLRCAVLLLQWVTLVGCSVMAFVGCLTSCCLCRHLHGDAIPRIATWNQARGHCVLKPKVFGLIKQKLLLGDGTKA